ncbi:branched-chain-amino-acid transaminase [Candidatus Gottesmanbacteria bacterium RBG_16_38_7b]|uniref:Branched-chain-amino-acid aminotransferase n=1 Tax=Candidatus Gottesmanbacteria bacterium RBG_16_38_7b TaxID=1798372 RepID=A0A1F5YKV9_9BACT|nr:MAG: branched-chain-amino-acid transaminase [Candidatus Gottesmanbacteria bacterium RBG_16_38_7b]
MNESFLPFAFFEGKIIPAELAKVSIMTNALQYGNAVFSGIRAYQAGNKKNYYIFRLDDHYKRILASLKILNAKIPYSLDLLVRTTLELAEKNQPKSDFYIRPIAYASNYEISPDMSKLTFDLAIYMVPMGEYLPLNKGLKVAISNWVRINDNMIPARGKVSGGYINSSLAKGDAVRLGFDDALMLSSDGHVSEASGANFFMVRDGILLTSPKYADVLEGVTRKTILQLANDLAISTVERNIDRTEVYIADEAFLTGTGAQLAWISQVDGRTIGDGKIGPLTAKIQKLFFSIVRGNERKYFPWLTKV